MNLDINVVLLYSIQMLSFLRNFIMRGNGITTFTSVSPVTPVALGLWGIQYDQKIIDCKVFQSNEDHCGCCVDVLDPRPLRTRMARVFSPVRAGL